jgi:hypothetical protein
MAIGIGPGDQLAIGCCLFAMDVEELRRGLEIRTSEARVGVRAVLLGRSAAVAVREGVADPRQVVLDPLGISSEGVGFEVQVLSGDSNYSDPGGQPDVTLEQLA